MEPLAPAVHCALPLRRVCRAAGSLYQRFPPGCRQGSRARHRTAREAMAMSTRVERCSVLAVVVTVLVLDVAANRGSTPTVTSTTNAGHYPLDALFKPASNISGVVLDTRLAGVLDYAASLGDASADDAVLAHGVTEAALRGGPCASALLRALPDNKLGALVILGALLVSGRGAIREPVREVVLGLMRARRLLPGYKVLQERGGRPRVVEVLRASQYDWASIFDNY
ncbi:Nonribosomal peptide synthetase ivoA [Frankliniella fusca]|uniref:Nonribosomal peptide synthetase ivoA n=1 Tax=Frankliniella fusca TaxID=407009 RepID=A0AAE1LI73_9NEOP|nr:Nonribosomal peptide synthetase ivoA [Frankliniella fusca]